MSKSYEELAGAVGRASLFRSQRIGAAALFAGAPPRAYFDDEEFQIADLSRSGVGCLAPESDGSLTTGDGGDRRGVLRLVQKGKEIFRAPARRVRKDTARGRIAVGFALDGPPIDLDDLARRNARALAVAAHAPASGLVSADYKLFCAEITEFLGDHLNRIDQHLTPIEDRLSERDKDDIAFELERAAAPEWLALLERGNRLVLDVHRDKKTRSALKVFTERTVSRVLIEGAGWARSYFKPLGYPGDFQIMNWIYDGAPIGDTIRKKFLHLLSLTGSYAVKTRMQALADLIVQRAQLRGDDSRPFDMISIGAGPARELEDVMASAAAGQSFRATLIDQEVRALEHALASARRIDQRDRLKVDALNISFKEMLNPSPLADRFLGKDLIYSAGLVDYLNPLLAQRFVKRLYQFLNPGGAVIIGNVNDLPSGMIWSSEYAVDWTLYFRNESEMIAMAAELDGARISVEEDSLRAIYFLIVEKPAA